MKLLNGLQQSSVSMTTILAAGATVMVVALAITVRDHQDRIEDLEKRLALAGAPEVEKEE